MSKYISNNKIIQDVQDTGDKAARLLADLENCSSSNSSSQKLDNASFRLKTSKYNSKEKNDSNVQSNALIGPAVVVSVIVLFWVAGILSGTNNSSNMSSNEINGSAVARKDKVMSSSQRNFYKQTLEKASDAVLISEHKSAIRDLEKLKRGEYFNMSDVDRGLVNNRIIQAQKKIKYLDQPGEDEYWESTYYGFQWFDEQTNNNFKVFFAYSKTCKNPLVTFKYIYPNSDIVVKTKKVRPRENISTLYVPHYRGNSLRIEGFRCN